MLTYDNEETNVLPMDMKQLDNMSFSAYLDITSKDKSFLLYATSITHTIILPSIGDVVEKPLHNSTDSKWLTGTVSSQFKVIYVTEGESFFRSFIGDVKIVPGTLLIILPGERYSYQYNSSSGINEYSISFDGEIPKQWLENHILHPDYMVYEYGISRTLTKIFDDALSIAKKGDEGFQQLLASAIMDIIAKMYIRRTYFFNNKKNTTLLDAAKELFEENIYEKFDVDTICQQLKVNYYTLRNYFKEHTGYSPYQYLLNTKIEKAKELLKEGKLSVKEVSFTLAFDSPYYFSRLFKAKTGVSPSAWANPYGEDSL